MTYLVLTYSQDKMENLYILNKVFFWGIDSLLTAKQTYVANHMLYLPFL